MKIKVPTEKAKVLGEAFPKLQSEILQNDSTLVYQTWAFFCIKLPISQQLPVYIVKNYFKICS